MVRVLLTSIEPFGSHTVNSSSEAVRLVEADPVPGVDLVVVELSCVYGKALRELRHVVDRVGPDVVVATGQGGRRPDVTVEMVAVNLDDSGSDNRGNRPSDEPIVADGPASYFSSLPVKKCVTAIREAGVPASVSHSAGTYLCNHVAYGLAHLIATEHPELRGGFVHIPFTPAQAAKDTRGRPPSMASATAAEALRAVIRTAVADLSPDDRSVHGAWSRRLRALTVLIRGRPAASAS
uniref:Pyroglutamyl-peptidase I n=1 Tax=Streptomyces sp. NBC_00003 TaxID=2903608 RepID=A0AAU2UVV4_9ACTN